MFEALSSNVCLYLIVEGEPGDVDGAGGLEDAGGDVGAEARAAHHHVRLVRRVKRLAGRVVHQDVRRPDRRGRHSDVLKYFYSC